MHGEVGAGVLADCWADFRRLDWRWHLLAMSLLIGVLAVRVAPSLLSGVPQIDELCYERAFALAAVGESPYGADGYYYPPAFAFVGSLWTRYLGVITTRALYRVFSLVAAAATCWLAAAWWWSPSLRPRVWMTERIAVALGLMLATPGVHLGIEAGNFSLTAAGLINAALHAAEIWPVSAGALLGISLMTKPLAAILVPALLGTTRVTRGRSAVTAIVAGTLGAGALLLVPFRGEMLALEMTEGTFAGTISLLRLLRLLHVDLGQVTLLALLSPLAFLAARRFGGDRSARICIALTLVLVTAPAIWLHTATLFFPVPVMALSLVRARFARQPGGWARAPRRARLELALVASVCVAVLFLNGGGFDRLDTRLQVILVLAPLAAPLLLCAYVLRSSTSSPRVSATPAAAAAGPR